MEEFEQEKLGITHEKSKELLQRFKELSSSEKSQFRENLKLIYSSCGIKGNSLSKAKAFVICLYQHFSELDEEQALFMLMKKADRNDIVSEKEVMKELQRIISK